MSPIHIERAVNFRVQLFFESAMKSLLCYLQQWSPFSLLFRQESFEVAVFVLEQSLFDFYYFRVSVV